MWRNQGDSPDSPSLPPFGIDGLSLPPISGRLVKWAAIIVSLLVAVLVISILRGVYTNWLWFHIRAPVKLDARFRTVPPLSVSFRIVGDHAFRTGIVTIPSEAFRLTLPPRSTESCAVTPELFCKVSVRVLISNAPKATFAAPTFDASCALLR